MAVNCSLSFINNQIEKNKLSHAFLLETNNMDECYNDVKKLIQKINCNNQYNEECSKCNLCKLVNMNNLPSFITIRPDGMSIKRQQLEELEKSFSKKPVFSKYNIYVIINAEKMTESAANTILKFLEEPEENILGFILTINKNCVLPTIISRCEYSFVHYDDKADNQDMKDLAKEYLNKIESTDDYLVNKKLILAKYNTREDLEVLFKNIFKIEKNNLEQAYIDSSLNKLIKRKEKRISIIQKVLQLIKFNVNLELILDYFVIEMRRTND